MAFIAAPVAGVCGVCVWCVLCSVVVSVNMHSSGCVGLAEGDMCVSCSCSGTHMVVSPAAAGDIEEPCSGPGGASPCMVGLLFVWCGGYFFERKQGKPVYVNEAAALLCVSVICVSGVCVGLGGWATWAVSVGWCVSC